ncbi:Tetraspanin-10 [Vitis vinifera]|uniref:Tetraspanin-10 n=1 Tax=Vitis vinifera TaxID=29760 RepID=A0A438BNG4_VITVI|nr:Tetraspanin-10 [Vitis vinifera]
MSKMEAILAWGILDAGGRNFLVCTGDLGLTPACIRILRFIITNNGSGHNVAGLRCGYPTVNASYYDLSFHPISSNKDCKLYKNSRASKCYNYDSCKAGVAQYMKTEWRVVAIFNVVLFVVLAKILRKGQWSTWWDAVQDEMLQAAALKLEEEHLRKNEEKGKSSAEKDGDSMQVHSPSEKKAEHEASFEILTNPARVVHAQSSLNFWKKADMSHITVEWISNWTAGCSMSHGSR